MTLRNKKFLIKIFFLGNYPDINNEIHVTPNPPKYCANEDYTGFWYGCYKLHRNPQSWESAKSICQGEGAYLVTIVWDAENAGVQLMTANDDLPVWTGGRDVSVFYALDTLGTCPGNRQFCPCSRSTDNHFSIGLVKASAATSQRGILSESETELVVHCNVFSPPPKKNRINTSKIANRYKRLNPNAFRPLE